MREAENGRLAMEELKKRKTRLRRLLLEHAGVDRLVKAI